MRPIVVLVAALAVPSVARADADAGATASMHVTLGVDRGNEYPDHLYEGLSFGASYRFLTAEIGVQTSSPVLSDEYSSDQSVTGLIATAGVHADLRRSSDGWDIGFAAAAGVRRARGRSSALVTAGFDFVRWYGSGFGVSFRFAGTATDSNSVSVEGGLGIARRW